MKKWRRKKGREVSAEALWLKAQNEGEGRNGCGPHNLLELDGLGRGPSGPRMKSTKKTKMILIKSSFQKVYF